MRNEQLFDIVIVGFSFSGVAAAIRLASEKYSVCIIDYYQDTISFQGTAIVQPTDLNSKEISGIEFENLVFNVLRDMKVPFIRCSFIPDNLQINNKSKYILLNDNEQGSISTEMLIFAPSGSEFGYPKRFPKKFLGNGISYDAHSDGCFFKNKPVVVIGSGVRAVEQAFWLSKYSSFITILSEDKELLLPAPWTKLLNKIDNLELLYDIKLNSVLSMDEKNVSSITFKNKYGKDFNIPTKGIFVGKKIKSDWTIWGGEKKAQKLIKRHNLIVAGLPNFIDYSNHQELYMDGVYSAEKILKENRKKLGSNLDL